MHGFAWLECGIAWPYPKERIGKTQALESFSHLTLIAFCFGSVRAGRPLCIYLLSDSSPPTHCFLRVNAIGDSKTACFLRYLRRLRLSRSWDFP
ncbi:hypothetical protein VNO77_19262 [Canavalia gladiata]|uniref:Uncharacterized protein n=1 Tax=Canavalia gladiata TaxID=3824 RepID=A0AAN9LM60_CANGL